MTVSHELHTPLNAIYGWARLLGTGRVNDEQRSRALATIERNARAQARLIDDLLDVSRVISGKLRLDVKQINPGDMLNLAVDAMRAALDAKSLRFETSIEPEVGTITADPERLQQIVWNLLSNATKFTPEAGRIQLRMSRQNSHVELVVADTGIGISPDFLPYVFERFRQQDAGSRRRFGGLGLGLVDHRLARPSACGRRPDALKKKLHWDSEAMKATNAPEADKFIRREYRKGREAILTTS
jgi:signal transduction histidine kinase